MKSSNEAVEDFPRTERYKVLPTASLAIPKGRSQPRPSGHDGLRHTSHTSAEQHRADILGARAGSPMPRDWRAPSRSSAEKTSIAARGPCRLYRYGLGEGRRPFESAGRFHQGGGRPEPHDPDFQPAEYSQAGRGQGSLPSPDRGCAAGGVGRAGAMDATPAGGDQAAQDLHAAASLRFGQRRGGSTRSRW